MAKSRALYQLKVTLGDIQPPIWRRIQIWEDTTLAQLHTILQIVMGWEDYHLHEFAIGCRLYSLPDPDDERKIVDERRVSLAEVMPRVGTQFVYLYDFGDSWEHDVLLETILLPETATPYPRCTGGERRTPPEDVGGVHGYEDYLTALADPEHAEHENMLQWRGRFDPETFSPALVNRQLQKKFRSRKLQGDASAERHNLRQST